MKAKKVYHGSAQSSIERVLRFFHGAGSRSQKSALKTCQERMFAGQIFTLYEITIKPLKKYKVSRSITEVKFKSGGKK